MNVLTKVLGVLVIIGGIVLGIWLDIVVLLVGGIQLIVTGLTTDPMNGGDIGWGVAHLVFFGIGGFVAVVIILIGVGLITLGRVAFPHRRKFPC